jgi:hypothetical protein
MEHNLARYAKYYSCGNIEITKSSEFTRETDTIKEIFLGIGKWMLETSCTLNLGQLLKIAPQLKRYLWQNLKSE